MSKLRRSTHDANTPWVFTKPNFCTSINASKMYKIDDFIQKIYIVIYVTEVLKNWGNKKYSLHGFRRMLFSFSRIQD